MNVGELFKCTVEKVVPGGDGMARTPEGEVLFIARALPGEELLCRTTTVKKNYLKGEIVRIDRPSAMRVEPACPYYSRCANCAFYHVDPAGELSLKNAQLSELLAPLGIPDSAHLAPVDSPQVEFYRNKAQLHVHRAGKLIDLGYIREDNRTVIDIAHCRLLAEPINAKLAELRNDKGFASSLHDHIGITFRYSSADGKVAYWRNAPDRRASWLKEDLLGVPFSVPAGSFCQINWPAAQLLASEVAGMITRTAPPLLLDLYCGAGFFSCAAVQNGCSGAIRAVELDPEAIQCAAYNLRLRNRTDAELVSGDAAQKLAPLLRDLASGTLAVIDPPRAGLAGKVADSLGHSALERLIYVSCDPATFVRDVKRLNKFGFKLATVRLFNLFPRTKHFETVGLLER